MGKLFVGDREVKVEADALDLDARVAMIQALIPIGLEAVSDVLQHEVQELAGGRYARKSPDQSHRRWGKQKGWVYLGDQKLPIEVPCVRDTATGVEVALRDVAPSAQGDLLSELQGLCAGRA